MGVLMIDGQPVRALVTGTSGGGGGESESRQLYSLDGLVLMYDGIDNFIAPSTHSTGTRTWYDKSYSGNDAMKSLLVVNDGMWTQKGYQLNDTVGRNTFECVNMLDFSTSFTMEVSVTPELVVNREQDIIVNWAASGHGICMENGQYLSAVYTNGYRYANGINAEIGVPAHLCMTYDYDSLKFYVNGILADSNQIGDGYTLAQRSITIGNNYKNDYPFTGTIHTARIYNSILTDAEILAHYQTDARRYFGS